MNNRPWRYRCFACVFILSALPAHAAGWSTTELHYQGGDILNPFADDKQRTHILTYQHASGWAYGDNFFFIDYFSDDKTDGFNDDDFYGELYLSFSLGKISGKSLSVGALKDVGLIAGLNIGGDANVRKYLPGVRLSWSVPGFKFLNTDLTAYIDDSGGLASGGAPAHDDSWMLDINGAYPFTIGQQKFAIQGHMEYIAEREDELGRTVEAWILAQPQFRWDMGHGLWGRAEQIFLGIEYQYWRNKLGTDEDESVAQLLLVWRL